MTAPPGPNAKDERRPAGSYPIQIASTSRSNDLYAWTGHSNGTISTTANGRNQIASWVNTLGYDAKGNIVTDGTYTYTYSSENLLTSLTNPAMGAIQSSSTYSYDPLMRLAKIDSSNPALDAELGYDGMEIVLEGLSEGRTRRYVFGPGVDEPLVAYLVTATGTSRSWYLADERGSIVRQTNDAGNPTGGIGRYDEYGIGPGTSRFQYTGQYWLGDANLHYYRARVYDPKLGRFLQPDPIGYEGGMNLYAYVGGDPVNLGDPSGLVCKNFQGDPVEPPTGSRICGGHGAASGYGGIAGSMSGSTTAGPGGAGGPTFGEAYAAAKDAVGGYGSGAVNAAADYFMGRVSLGQVRVALNAGRNQQQLGLANMLLASHITGAYVPDDQLPSYARILIGRRIVDPATGNISLVNIPASYKLVLAPRGGGALLVPSGWTPGSRVNVIRLQPAGTGSTRYNPNGYYVVYGQSGAALNIRTGQQVKDTAPEAHNHLGGVLPPFLRLF